MSSAAGPFSSSSGDIADGGDLLVQSCLTVLRPHGLQPTNFLCPWDSTGRNTGVGCHFPSPGHLPDPSIKPAYPTLAGRFFII